MNFKSKGKKTPHSVRKGKSPKDKKIRLLYNFSAARLEKSGVCQMLRQGNNLESRWRAQMQICEPFWIKLLVDTIQLANTFQSQECKNEDSADLVVKSESI